MALQTPVINASATITVSDPAQNQTSSFPYYSIGPIDFSGQNFVRTCQTDYYYATSTPVTANNVLVSQVSQCYDPTIALWNVVALVVVFIGLLFWTIKKVKRF
jgi:hypothetical protein